MREEGKRKHEMDLCNGPIMRRLFAFSLPIVLSGLLQLTFNAADVIVVGKYAGDNSLAAVGSTGSLINLLTNLFMGLSVGASVLTARYFGAHDEKSLQKTIHTAITVSAVSGVLLTIIGLLGAEQILIWMNSPENVRDLSALYLRIYFLGMTPMMLYNFGSSILRSVGDTKRPLYFLTFAGAVNVVLNLIFVILLKMDVAGVALATVLSQCLSCVLILRCLIKEEGMVHLDLKKLCIDKNKFFQILRIGLPAGFQGTIFSLSNVVIQSSINSFGEVVVAGSSAASNLEGFVYVSMNAMHQAAISFTGQNMGAGKLERIPKIAWLSQVSVLVIGLLLGNCVYAFSPSLLGFYTDSASVVASGIDRLKIIGPTYALCGMMDVMVGVIRGIGYSVLPMLVSLIGVCGLRLMWLAVFFPMEQFHTIEMVYITYPVSWLLTLLAHVVCFLIIWKKYNRGHDRKT